MSTAVTKKIESILKSAFDVAKYVDLTQEIFPAMKIVAPGKLNREMSNFSSYIEGYTHIGTYNAPDKSKIIIMAVRLKNAVYVENSRTVQRNYAKKLIESTNADAAFVSFYTDGNPKWRLSLVCLDYEMKFENGKMQMAENLTPAKRYSYLVGEQEPCHTAISRFERFITDNQANTEQFTLKALEDTFSVEKVTNEFFQMYCEKFYQLQELLEGNENFRIEAEHHNFTSAQFAKKLMGQIVFLYFLQKKGWLGVKAWPPALTESEYKNAFFAQGAKSRELIPIVYRPVGDGTYKLSASALERISDADEEVLARCVKGMPWGSGPQQFMRQLFNYAEQKNVNFYNEILEPLFYDALNVNRGTQSYCPALHCRIPFLSGGLFEPIDGYDWEHNDFSIPNSVFSNVKEKEWAADGILDVFDRYNFTMSEDEPMEREVAIDPEMLGKVFENLLEIKDRKSKGAFYTPREIVHYMCQESLIRYLCDTMNLDEAPIRDFILYGDIMKAEDTVKEKRMGNGGLFIDECLFSIDATGKVVKNRLDEMDRALQSVRVADPAVGSGAFPLGMLNEIVRARQNITEYMIIGIRQSGQPVPQINRSVYNLRNSRSAYILKRDTIQNCIFAADIEPSAVDIAQLRLWLALVIDDEINPDARSPLDGHSAPIPLPNLESNILCGNSLIDEIDGLRLVNESEILGNANEGSQIDFTQKQFDAILQKLIDKQDELFNCENTEKKHALLSDIEALKDQIVENQIYDCSGETRVKYEESKHMASKPYVLWQLDFARVFREKGGFDIVIGNPPYIQLQKEINEATGEKLGDQYQNMRFESFAKTGDIYCLFYEKGHRLLHNGGVLSFITSNKWMRAGYGEKLRGFFAGQTNPLLLIDFAGTKVFESATVDVNILMFKKSENQGSTIACIAKNDCLNNLSVFVMQNSSRMRFSSRESWTILSSLEQSIKQKIEAIGTPLKDWNINIYRGILTGYNEAFIISGEKKDELIAADPKSAEIIRPILRGRDIKRYSYEWSGLWIIATFPSRKYNIDDFPAVRDYLLSFGKERLEQTGKKYVINGERISARKKTNNKWYETQDSISYWDDFSKQRIIYREISDAMDACIVEQGMMINNKCYMIAGEHLIYLICFINSLLFNKIILQGANITGGKGVAFLNPIKLPKPTLQDEAEIRMLYTSKDESGIDRFFCKKFGLSDMETAFILQE